MTFKKILVTGANGFLGRAIAHHFLMKSGEFEVIAAVRRCSDVLASLTYVKVDNLSSETQWGQALKGVDVVIHTAARVHVMRDSANDPLEEFRQVNVEGTLNLARQAVVAGVRRFIFISSIKVNGEMTSSGKLFTAEDFPEPSDNYGISKLEAENGLKELMSNTSMEIVIIRPPLIYGPGVKANFELMIKWLQRGLPLPFGAINNKRSLVALDNLIDLIEVCLNHPAAVNQVFLVSDGEDLSTTQLLRCMANKLGKSVWLMPIPAWILEWGAKVVGKLGFAQRLCGSLQVDISKTRQLLGWVPVVSVNEGLKKTAEYWLVKHAEVVHSTSDDLVQSRS